MEKIEDLASGMELDGVVTNTTSFGVFVDIGVHQDGLVHKKHLPSKTPAELHPGQKIRVSVLEVDLERKRIALSMKNKGKGKKS